MPIVKTNINDVPQWIVILLLFVFGGAFLGMMRFVDSYQTEVPATVTPSCETAGGKIYTGVKLYPNSSCTESFATVLGGGDGQLRIQYPDGSEEWKDRASMANNTYLKTDDPAIAAQQWVEFKP